MKKNQTNTNTNTEAVAGRPKKALGNNVVVVSLSDQAHATIRALKAVKKLTASEIAEKAIHKLLVSLSKPEQELVTSLVNAATNG